MLSAKAAKKAAAAPHEQPSAAPPASGAGSLEAIFDEAQNPHANFQHLLKQFWKLERKCLPAKFQQDLIHCVNQLLVVLKREPSVESLTQFVALALTSYDQELQISGLYYHKSVIISYGHSNS